MASGVGQLVVTVDVEPDRQWDSAPSVSLANLARLPRLHDVLRAAGARPTYLVSYAVCADDQSARILADLRGEGCEIGAHLHPWDTPPLTPADADGGPKPFPTELEENVLRDKLANLTRALEERIGQRPVSHRAGRWALDGRGLRALEDLGYRVDTSVTPLVSWERHRGRAAGSRGPCYKRAPAAPYRPDRDDVCRPGSSPVLEVPVSIAFARRLPVGVREWYRRAPDSHPLVRAVRKSGLVRPTWFRPTRTSAARMIAAGERLLAEGAPVLNMAFHSSEALPGGSAYLATERQVEQFLERIAETLAYFLRRRGLEAALLSEVRAPAPSVGAV